MTLGIFRIFGLKIQLGSVICECRDARVILVNCVLVVVCLCGLCVCVCVCVACACWC